MQGWIEWFYALSRFASVGFLGFLGLMVYVRFKFFLVDYLLVIKLFIVLKFVEVDHKWLGMSWFGFVCSFACLVVKNMQEKKSQTRSLGKNMNQNMNILPKKVNLIRLIFFFFCLNCPMWLLFFFFLENADMVFKKCQIKFFIIIL